MEQTSSVYTKEFQINLVAHLVRDGQLMQAIVGYLKLTDFDLPACQLVYEALRNYYIRFRAVPDFETFKLHVIKTMQNVANDTLTILSPEEYESLAIVS